MAAMLLAMYGLSIPLFASAVTASLGNNINTITSSTTTSTCFISSSSLFATENTSFKSHRIPAILISPLSMADNNDDNKTREKISTKYRTGTKRRRRRRRVVPRYQEEVVGISSGLNLLRINKRIRIRHSIKHTLNSMKQRRSKGRRKKLATKFKQYVLGADYFDSRMSRKLGVIFESVDTDNSGTIDLAEYTLAIRQSSSSSSSISTASYLDEVIEESFNEMDADGNGEISRGEFNSAIMSLRRKNKAEFDVALPLDVNMEVVVDDNNDDDTCLMDDDEDEDENLFASLDAMRAKSGVLRTRIRLRQGTLSSLERLTAEVELEMRRSGWPYSSVAGRRQQQEVQLEVVADKSNNYNTGDDLMNESNLVAINEKWKNKQNDMMMNVEWEAPSLNDYGEREAEDDDDYEDDYDDVLSGELQLELMRQRSLKLQSSILLDRIRLQRLERRILCFETDELNIIERGVGNTLDTINEFELQRMSNPITVVRTQAKKFVNTFGLSTSVLLRKLDRVQSQQGTNNREYASVTDFVVREGAAGVRIVGNLLSNPSQLQQLVDPSTPTLIPHVPAILGRLDKLESHVAPILSRVLNNKQHLPTIEPYLDEILERFDDIEPHLPWILDHIDTLAPYTGLLLKHIDELLLYAEVDEYEAGVDSKGDRYAFAEQLLPYLEVYVSQLDLIGPHLPLLRPHLPLMLKYNRIAILSPHVGKLFNKGYKDLSASANMDILLFYFGWALRIPFVPWMFFSFPGSPGMVSALANRLPKRLVRRRSWDVTCHVDGDYGDGWNALEKYSK